MKINITTLALISAFSFSATAQDVAKKTEVKYRRSSLYMIMIDDAALPKANIIKTAFATAPIPDKYNDHSLPAKSFVSQKYALTAEEKAATGKKADGKGMAAMKGMAKGAASNATGGLIDTTNTKNLPQIIAKYLNANNVGVKY